MVMMVMIHSKNFTAELKKTVVGLKSFPRVLLCVFLQSISKKEFKLRRLQESFCQDWAGRGWIMASNPPDRVIQSL